MKGFLLIDKAGGMTSFDVIRSLKKQLSCKRIGHTGTLDPLATGLLLVAVGEGTKLVEFFLGLDKVYEVEAVFGFVSDTFDADGSLTQVAGRGVNGLIYNFDRERVKALLKENFSGLIKQIPPKFSALKVDGHRAYDLARQGVEFEMKAREVQVFENILLDFGFEEGVLRARIRIHCSSGTYVRSLVHDLGQVLECGAYVKELRRMRVGDFDIADALKLENVFSVEDLVPLEYVVRKFSRIELSESEYQDLLFGRVLRDRDLDGASVAMAFLSGTLVAVLEECEKPFKGIKVRKIIKS